MLPGHTPFFTSLRTGAMWYRQGGEKHFLMVSVGFVEVLPDSVSVLAQVAERAEDLDQARAEAGMKRAEEVMGVGAARDRFRTRAARHAAHAAADAGGKPQKCSARIRAVSNGSMMLAISLSCSDTAG